MAAGKIDHEPLLAPGAHHLSLSEIKNRFVNSFPLIARQHRYNLFMKFEQFLQELLTSNICCTLYVDGSFFTRNPAPNDFDVLCSVDEDAYNALSDAQIQLITQINMGNYIEGIDASILVAFPRGHPLFGTYCDPRITCSDYGLQHNGEWTKGYGVLRLRETDVGLRICH